jgi:hypothetical protein
MCKKRTIRRNMERQLKKILTRGKCDLETFGQEHCLDGNQAKESSEIDRVIDAIGYSNQEVLYYGR